MRSRIGVLISTTRPSRKGVHVAHWVYQCGLDRGDADYELLDPRVLDLPFLAEEEDPVTGLYTDPAVLRWAAAVQRLDALMIVTAEYNSGYPAPLKNALDLLGPEWKGLPVAVVGYGGISAGTRSVAALLPVLVHLEMLPVGHINLRLRDRLDSAGAFVADPEDEKYLVDLHNLLVGASNANLRGRHGSDKVCC